MKDKIFEIFNYDLDRLYISTFNKTKGIYIHSKVAYIAGRQECVVDDCDFNKSNLILITDTKKTMRIQEINKPFLKEILKFILNNDVIDYKIVNK